MLINVRLVAVDGCSNANRKSLATDLVYNLGNNKWADDLIAKTSNSTAETGFWESEQNQQAADKRHQDLAVVVNRH